MSYKTDKVQSDLLQGKAITGDLLYNIWQNNYLLGHPELILIDWSLNHFEFQKASDCT